MAYKLIGAKAYIKLFLLIQIISFISSTLEVIRLGNKYFRFIHFSSNLNGDMIIDTSAYPIVDGDSTYKERRFYGLKKNGRFYFKDDNNKETPFASIFTEKAKTYSESCFIQLSNSDDNKEYLLSVSSISSYYAELYDLEDLTYTLVVSNLYINAAGGSHRSALFRSSLKDSTNKNYNIISVIRGSEDSSYFYLIKNYLETSNIVDERAKRVKLEDQGAKNLYIVSCFETTLNVVICLYQNDNLVIYTYDLINGANYFNILDIPLDKNIKIFFKGVHLKEEIGFFMYYISTSSISPYFSIKKYNSATTKMETYNSFDHISLTKVQFNPDISLNDLMKINDTKICFASVSPDKNILYIIIFNLFDEDTKMMINYYLINIFELNNIKII